MVSIYQLLVVVSALTAGREVPRAQRGRKLMMTVFPEIAATGRAVREGASKRTAALALLDCLRDEPPVVVETRSQGGRASRCAEGRRRHLGAGLSYGHAGVVTTTAK